MKTEINLTLIDYGFNLFPLEVYVELDIIYTLFGTRGAFKKKVSKSVTMDELSKLKELWDKAGRK